MSRFQKTAFFVLVVVLLIVGLSISRLLTSTRQPPELVAAGVLLLPQSNKVPSVSMIDQDGATVRLDQLQGYWTLMFFGYTNCPDVCPATLGQLRQIRSELPAPTRERLQVIFVSVDPSRDTPLQLKHYLQYFDTSFRALVGTPESLEQLANGLSIPYIPADTSKPGYTVQHSANLALLGPDGTQRGFIRAPLNSAKLLAQLPALLKGD